MPARVRRSRVVSREDVGRVGVRRLRVLWRLTLECGHVVERAGGPAPEQMASHPWSRRLVLPAGDYGTVPWSARCDVCHPRRRPDDLWAPAAAPYVVGLLNAGGER